MDRIVTALCFDVQPCGMPGLKAPCGAPSKWVLLLVDPIQGPTARWYCEPCYQRMQCESGKIQAELEAQSRASGTPAATFVPLGRLTTDELRKLGIDPEGA